MKITQHNADTLTLQVRPWFLWFFSATFSLTGLAIILWMGTVTTLSCRRSGPDGGACVLATSRLLQTHQRQLAVSDVQSARVMRGFKNQNIYQVQIMTRQGMVPLQRVHSSGYGVKQQQVEQITAFLAQPTQTELVVQDDQRWFAYSFGSLFVLSGLAVSSLFGQVVTCCFDKASGCWTLHRHGLLGQSTVQQRLDDIVAVDLEESRGNNSTTYRVSLVTCPDPSDRADRDEAGHVPITTYYSAGYEDKQEVADCIRTFLNLKEPMWGDRPH